MNREIVLDTETTGLSFENGDRIIEIACVELINHLPTGSNLQLYFNPETKNLTEEAIKIHGLDINFLRKKSFFREKVKDIKNFISSDTLIIHNAVFDLGFINNELILCNEPQLENPVIDTLKMAKEKFSSGPVNLDALCKRFKIDTSMRKLHGALLDSNLLAEVYIELLGGRQTGLPLSIKNDADSKKNHKKTLSQNKKTKLINVSEPEKKLHKQMTQEINKPLWQGFKY